MTGGQEPHWITEDVLLAIHARQIERYGGAHGVLDQNVVRSALARPMQRRAYDAGADMSALAAAYLVGFARSQGFRDGNKRTALASALVFLALNSLELHVPPDDLYAIVMGASLQRLDDDAVAKYIRERINARR